MKIEKKIDICCLQEIDIPINYNHELLSFKGYELLRENEVKSRMGMYVKNGINYVRKSELEGINKSNFTMKINHSNLI